MRRKTSCMKGYKHQISSNIRQHLISVVFIFLPIMMFLLSCGYHQDVVLRQVCQVRNMIYSHPDSAMTLLEQIPDSVFDNPQLDYNIRMDLFLFRVDQLMRRQEYVKAQRWMERAMLLKRKIYEKEHALHSGNEQRSMTSFWMNPTYWSVIGILSIGLLGAVFYDRKSEQLLLLHTSMKEKEDETVLLSSQLFRIQQATTEQLGMGKLFFEQVINGGNMRNISIEEEQCFIDYYAFAYPQDFKGLTSSY